MRKGTTWRGLTAAILAVIVVVSAGTMATAAAQTSAASTVLQLRMTGVVDPFVADYVTRGIRDATSAGDAAVLLEIDTSGGLNSSMHQITEAILNAQIPVIGYVGPAGAQAASSGAFVLMSTPIAAMAPGTDVGAATPTGFSGATGSQSAVDDAATYMEALAQHRRRNVALAGSFVTGDVSITAQQALDGNIADLLASSETQLLSSVDGRSVALEDGSSVTLHTAGATIETRDLSGLIGFLHELLDPTVAFIFFWLGLALVVLELLFPGHIVSGVLGVLLLICAFMTFGLLPVRLVGVVLLLASAVALIVEARHPGPGIWGVLGLVFLVLGGWFLYERSGGAGVPVWVIGAMALFVAFFFGIVVVKARKLRDLPPPAGARAVVGLEGVALGSGLNPSGVVRVAAEEWRATSTTGPIPGGKKVKVIGLDGLVLTVESAVDSHAPSGQAPAVPRPDVTHDKIGPSDMGPKDMGEATR